MFSFAKTEINIAYRSRTGSFVKYPDNYVICPYKTGITSTWERLRILYEFMGQSIYKLHTIEVHDKIRCNANLMQGIRQNFLQQSLDPYNITSLSLNNRPVLDIDYHRAFINKDIKDHDLDVLEIYLWNTQNSIPGSCNLRLFIELK